MSWLQRKSPGDAAGVDAHPADAPSPRHILFPYRASQRADRALQAAAELARDSGAKLTVLAPVVLGGGGRRCCGLQGQKWAELLRDAADDDLTRARRVLGGAEAASYVLGEGRTLREVLKDFAREHDCDLTVIAPSVLGGLVARRRPLRAHALPVRALPR